MFPLGNSVSSERKRKHFFSQDHFAKGPRVFTVIIIHVILFYFIVCHRETEIHSSQCDIFGFQADMLFNKSSNMCFPRGIKSGM